MIKVNLLGDSTIRDYSKEIALGVFGGSLAVVIFIFFCFSMYLSSDLEETKARHAALDEELKKYQTQTAEVKEIEKRQKDLQSRLVRIAILKKSKQGPVKLINDLNMALPERAWITEIRENAGKMKIQGFAVDGETVSNFTRALEKSEFFPKVDLDQTQQAAKQGVKIQNFSIKADVSYGGRIQAAEKDKAKKTPAKPQAASS